MLLIDFLSVLYEETLIEICIDYNPVFTGIVEDVPLQRFKDSKILEAFISFDGDKLIISIKT